MLLGQRDLATCRPGLDQGGEGAAGGVNKLAQGAAFLTVMPQVVGRRGPDKHCQSRSLC